MRFEVVGKIVDLEIIASGRRVRQRRRLVKTYGGSRWRKYKGVANVRLHDGTMLTAELHLVRGSRRRAQGGQDQALAGDLMKQKRKAARFVVCIRNTGYPASLEVRKVYRVLADPDGEKHGLVRVIDEDGEDYLYPSEYFVPIAVGASAARAIAVAS